MTEQTDQTEPTAPLEATDGEGVVPQDTVMGFDGVLDKLESIVLSLERGELSLETALERFETGIGLARTAGAVLDRAEARVEVLMRDRGELVAVPVDPGAVE